MVLTGGAVVVAGAGVAGVALFGDDDPSGADAEAASAEEPATLVEVVQRDLARTEELEGTVAYGTATPLVLAVEGTLTGLPEVGDVIGAGDVIAEVDGQPVIALSGPTPLWRTLGPGVDDGTDVLHVEYVLAAMGYAEEHDMTVDEEWTSATTEAVEEFQADHGQDDDGQIDLGEVVFIDGPVRVDAVAGALGQRASEAGIEVTSPERAVHVDLPVDDADLIAVGDAVEVELATGEVLPATVATIGSVETADDGSSTLPVTLTVEGGEGLADGSPVTVLVEIEAADGVLAVPVEALLALAEGGYAVERAAGGDDGTGRRRARRVRRRHGRDHRRPGAGRPGGRPVTRRSRQQAVVAARSLALAHSQGESRTAVLEMAGVVKRYPGQPPVEALAGIDLTVRAGEFVALVGPSGSGKSTLINVVGALQRPTAGTVRIDGHDIGRLARRAPGRPPRAAHRLRVPAVPPRRGADRAGERRRWPALRRCAEAPARRSGARRARRRRARRSGDTPSGRPVRR